MITIEKLTPADRPAWTELFRAYLDFYRRTEPEQTYRRAWEGFLADDRIHALGAKEDGRLVGITHFLVHANTSGPDVCYLQDLFTAPQARGRGVARALIGAVADFARERDCLRVYWMTHETNATARRLYDAVADNRGFIRYQIDLQAAGPR
ncbi:GNAT family N-acetyltransferase [Kitasatospora sp. NPDC058965]|uniref:GNAT family N-acetyltransferase n=1 Tax=Kitasatospora sp. NPDC058965 TaxID=3346682 RepID=UPI0036A2F0B3